MDCDQVPTLRIKLMAEVFIFVVVVVSIRVKRAGGLSSVLGQIGKKAKLSTLVSSNTWVLIM